MTRVAGNMADTEAGGTNALRDRIQAFVGAASYEMAAGDFEGLEAAKAFLPRGTSVSITWLPNDTHEQHVATAKALTDAGLHALPHIAARAVPSQAVLDQLLAQLADEAGVRRAFLIAGDRPTSAGPFQSVLEMMRSGLFEQRGFTELGIAGYPEGHPVIPNDVLWRELSAKLTTGWQAGIHMQVITQFCFDAQPILEWKEALVAQHPDVRIRVGLAGPANLRTLLRFAKRCGIGNSARAIIGRGASITRLMTEAGPDPVIRDLMANPAFHADPAPQLHLFPFHGLERTARWADTVARGNFVLAKSEAGFKLIK